MGHGSVKILSPILSLPSSFLTLIDTRHNSVELYLPSVELSASIHEMIEKGQGSLCCEVLLKPRSYNSLNYEAMLRNMKIILLRRLVMNNIAIKRKVIDEMFDKFRNFN